MSRNYAVIYNDPRLQIEKFGDSLRDAFIHAEELSETAVENLCIINIITEYDKEKIS